MKKIKTFIRNSVILLAGILSTACNDDRSAFDAEQEQGAPIEIFSTIRQNYISRVNDEGFCDGDQMGIYVVDYNGDTPGTLLTAGNRGDNVRYTYEEATGKWSASQTLYYKDKNTPINIYGYYPYASPQSIEAYAFSVKKDQSTLPSAQSLGGYEASDFLWGKTGKVAPSTQKAIVTLSHKLACVKISLAEGTGFAEGEWDQFEKSVLVTNTKRDASINLNNGQVTATGEISTTGIIPAQTGGIHRAIVIPQEVQAQTPLLSITVDGVPYIFRKPEIFTYYPQKMHTFIIDVNKKSEGGLEFVMQSEGIAAWEADEFSHDAVGKEYVVINATEAGTLKEAIETSGKDFTKVQNLKISGTINASDFYFMRDEMNSLQCLNLQEVRIAKFIKDEYTTYEADEIPTQALYSKTTLTRLTLPEKITKIGREAFESTNITGSVIIPEGVIEIGDRAFINCKQLSGTLTLPSTLTKIESYAFHFCSGLIGNLSIPQSVTFIGEQAFYQCSGFTGSLFLPENLEYIGGNAFAFCEGFTGSITIPDKIKIIPNSLFDRCKGLNGQLRFAQDITKIERYAFNGCQFRGELSLPETLTQIGDNAFNSNLFSGSLKLPSSLNILETGIFWDCSRFTGIITIPEGITSIPTRMFAGCGQIEGIVLPASMEQIGEAAFNGCFQVNSIICHAKEPPYLRAQALDGINKDNFTVQVPAESLTAYQTAPGWKEFKRISAYRDFSINQRLFRALNATFSRNLTLRALNEDAWEVESKPDWISVSPANGIGKAEITITFDALAQGAGDRTGKVVFQLSGKDYHLSLNVEQYDYNRSDGEIETLQTASDGNGINVVLLGDGFDAADIANGKYQQAMEEAYRHLFAVEPYTTYQSYFNVYTVYAHAPDNGIETVNTIRENKFHTRTHGGNDLDADTDDIFKYACKAPINDRTDRTLVIFIPNTNEYGGVTRMWGDGSAISFCPMSTDEYPYDFRGLVQHEAGGHGFGKLGDEYIYVNDYVDFCSGCSNEHAPELQAGQSRGWYQNLSLTNNYAKLPWSEFIFHPKYANTVDVYEGGWFHTRKVWRSEPNSCMNNNIPYFSAVSRREIVKRIMEYSGGSFDFDTFVEKDVTDASTGSRALPREEFRPPLRTPGHGCPPVYMGDKPNFKK